MDVAAVAAERSKINIVDKDKVGFNSMNSESFLKLMIAQLQNQDPTAPMSNEELLNQISSMRALQSNVELSNTLKSFGLSQQLSSGAALLGKNVTAVNASDQSISGVVNKVLVKDNVTYVQIGANEVPLSQVSQIVQ